MIITFECTNPWKSTELATLLAEKWNPKVPVSVHSLLGAWPAVVHTNPLSKELSLAADLIDEIQPLLPLARGQNLIFCHHLSHLYSRLTLPLPTVLQPYAPSLGIAPSHQFIFDFPLLESATTFIEHGLTADDARNYRRSLLLNQPISLGTAHKQTKLSGPIEHQLDVAVSVLALPSP
jgi:hypothetical protein